MLEKFFIIVLSLNILDATPSRNVFSGRYCYGDNYTVAVIGTLHCNGHPHKHARVEVKRCDESGLDCRNVFDVPLHDGNFNHTYQLDNKRGVDFSLWIYIYHKCCKNQYRILSYETEEYKKLRDDHFQCGTNLMNVKNYDLINLTAKDSTYYCYCEEYIVYISGKLRCFGKPLTKKTVNLMLCDKYGNSCEKVDTIHIKKNGSFIYKNTVSNLKKADSTMKLHIYNQCCSSRYQTYFEDPLSLDVFHDIMACGNVSNARNFETIEIKDIQCPNSQHIRIGRK